MAGVDADVVVAGGGLVGAAAALALSGLGRRVALIDRAEPKRTVGRLGFDTRTVALNPASLELLESLGLVCGSALQSANAVPASPFTRVYVWEELGTRHIEFHAHEVGRESLGVVAEVSAVLTALWTRLRADDRVTLLTGVDIDGVDAGADRVVVRAGDRTIAARLLVAADGGNSAVRRLLGVPATTMPTEHVALATVVETELPHQDTAAQRFLESGPLALLPLPSRDARHFVSIVWSSLADKTSALASLADRPFMDALERASERRLGRILDVDRRFTFALEQTVAASLNPTPRALLIGDAAHVLHPLAGQGVNLGFDDVRGLVKIAARLGDGDPGAPDVWRGFAAERRVRAELVVRAMDAFRVIYANDNPVFRWLRNVGVDLVDRAPVLKTQLIRQALGL